MSACGGDPCYINAANRIAMNLHVTFQPAASMTPDVIDFWRSRQAAQDPWKGLTGSPEWFVLMAAGAVKPAVVLVARGDHDQIFAVLPLLFQSMNIGRTKAPTARVCGGDVLVNRGAEGGDLKFEAEKKSAVPDLIAQLWKAITRHDPDVQAIILDHVDASRLPLIQASCARGSGFFMQARSKLMPHYRLILPANYDDFRKLRSASSLKKISGRERAMAREVGAECRLVEIRGPTDWAPYAADINRLMNSTWQAKRLGHGFDMDSCRPAAERGWLRSFLLLAGKKPAAFVLGYQGAPAAQELVVSCRVDGLLSEGSSERNSATQQLNNSTINNYAQPGRVFHYEQIGHDAELAKYSPGTTLLYQLVQRLYEQDVPACIDFGEGEAEYKSTLSNQVTCSQSVLVVRNRLGWRVRFGVIACRKMLIEAGLAVVARAGLKVRLKKWFKNS